MMNTRRYLQWYDKVTEFSVGYENMENIDLPELQKLFSVPPDNPMYDCWEVKEKHLETLQKHVKHIIDLSKYDYFVEASAQSEVKNT